MSTLSFSTILERLNIASLNAMQTDFINAAKEHNELVLLSPTGSGKTLAFLLPLLEFLKNDGNTTAMVVTPTRELALQIEQVFKKMNTGLKVTTVYGGHSREVEDNSLVEAPALIVGTPGRICDHIQRGNIETKGIEAIVLDEFDKSLELGFDDEMGFIFDHLPQKAKLFMTSATNIEEFPDYLHISTLHVVNHLESVEVNKGSVEQFVVHCSELSKKDMTFRLLCHLGTGRSIVFCSFRETVEEVAKHLSKQGISSVFYHGAMEQKDREVALCKFRNGSAHVLVSTDLAARGLDIPDVDFVLHYHLPATEDVLIHRNGRTARMHADGQVYILLEGKEYLPPFTNQEMQEVEPNANEIVPEAPNWATLFVNAGKKNKINKIDIVGFLSQKGKLKKEEIGLIEVKDFFAFVAIKRSKLRTTLDFIRDEKLKNQRIKIAPAR